MPVSGQFSQAHGADRVVLWCRSALESRCSFGYHKCIKYTMQEVHKCLSVIRACGCAVPRALITLRHEGISPILPAGVHGLSVLSHLTGF